MQHEGNLRKMRTRWGNPVQYELHLGEQSINVNALIGKEIFIEYRGLIHCKKCGRKTKKSFAQGFCYPCFKSAPENSECIIRPELCEAHLGKGRDATWEKENHDQPHIVYLALSSGVKVGVTRKDQIPTRWIDQGAWKAMILAETPNRQTAGKMEVFLKDYLSDKTHWQNMLKNVLGEEDLSAKKKEASQLLPVEYTTFLSDNNDLWEIQYPVMEFPKTIKSLNLDRQGSIKGTLTGIKGQYWILDTEQAINIRSHSGYYIYLTSN